jgi:hypothetical protein
VAELPLAAADLQLNKTVTAVQTLNPGLIDPAGRVTVSTADGSTHRFNHVVLTTPLGWLKKNKHIFTPALDARVANAIDAVSVGHLEKVWK